MEQSRLVRDRDLHIVVIGEVLFDSYPEFSLQRIGGAPFNFAYHYRQLVVALLLSVGSAMTIWENQSAAL